MKIFKKKNNNNKCRSYEAALTNSKNKQNEKNIYIFSKDKQVSKRRPKREVNFNFV